MGNVYKLEELRPDVLKSLDKSKTLFFITISPLENHGIHLPYGTDIVEGEGISKSISERFSKEYPDWNIVFCLPITLGYGTMPGFGSINIRQSVVRDFLIDYFSGLAKLGFKHIFVSGFHGNPRHLTAIDEAIVKVNKKYNSSIISPFGYSFINVFAGKQKIPNEEINEIFQKNKYDIHGGLFETSLVMYLRPDLVNEHEKMEELNLAKGNPIQKIKTAKKAYNNSYFGNPAGANPDIGKKLFDDIINLFYEVLIKSIKDPNFAKEVKNKFYYHPYTRTHFIKKFFAVFLVIAIPFIWLYKKNNN